ncbi:ABC transporter permease [Chryseolinea lacunae]|uniref:ABC transporter permease n=1 Tax=Chryseolinea lacunae TaxID=2801331 RepID=A0ABS1KKT0_9BACT|nr:ABC transporter permease [Chryseolinea lacunae]MBL0739817.1 ABC transporter permease [Chryseolinea lacunae]
MIRNYLIVAWRNLVRNRVFSTINVVGLAIGLSVCGLIYQYIQFERSYEVFNPNADRLYRVTLSNLDADHSQHESATNHPATAPAMKADFPEVEAFSRLARTNFFISSVTLSTQDKSGNAVAFNEEKMFLADAPFLTMFSYPMLQGNPATALKEPNSVVIAESVAKKFFGNEPALGKQLSLNRELNLNVTGVMKDIPQNSHLSFNVLVSFSSLGEKWGYDQWRWPEFYNYVLLKPGINAAAFENKFPAFVDKYLGDVKREYKWDIRMALQKVPSIHLMSNLALEQDTNGSERIVYFLGLLGIFVLVVAWINYINLSTAKSLERSKEVGLRKVVGASKRQLVVQFFFDAFLVNAMAMLLAAAILLVTMPLFEQLVEKQISAVLYQQGLLANPGILILAAIILLAGTLLVGAYPALMLSSFNPAQVLKGKFYKSASGQWLRKGLVSFQYVLSIFLIAGTITMYRQLSFMQNQDLGYAKDQVLVLKTPAVFDSTIMTHITWFKGELGQLASVKNASVSNGVPGRVLLSRNGIRKLSQGPESDFNCYQKSIDDNFLSTFGIGLVAGRGFTDKDLFVYDKEAPILINELMSRKLGYAKPEDAVNEKVAFGMGPREQHGEIVGVIKNYHQVSLHENYEPMMFIQPEFFSWNYISVHLEAGNMTASIDAVKKLYDEAFPNNAFEYFFLDEYFNRQYNSDVRLGAVFGIFTGLAIVIACLGLLGLSIFAVVHRTKEVGIRKVLGASVPTILALFSRDFIKLLLVAYVVAIPFVYFGVNRWLSDFAFHISPGWDVYLVPLVILALISITTVGFICFRAATANPTQSLRQE